MTLLPRPSALPLSYRRTEQHVAAECTQGAEHEKQPDASRDVGEPAYESLAREPSGNRPTPSTIPETQADHVDENCCESRPRPVPSPLAPGIKRRCEQDRDSEASNGDQPQEFGALCLPAHDHPFRVIACCCDVGQPPSALLYQTHAHARAAPRCPRRNRINVPSTPPVWIAQQEVPPSGPG